MAAGLRRFAGAVRAGAELVVAAGLAPATGAEAEAEAGGGGRGSLDALDAAAAV